MLPDDALVHVVGATGAVGIEALRILSERGVCAPRIRASASERSSGLPVRFGDGSLIVGRFDPDHVGDGDVVLLCTSASVSRCLAARCVERGAFVVDSSSAFRGDPGVPLVIPEINGQAIASSGRGSLVASPNCSTILLLTALEPLRIAFGVERIVVSTYQAVSGAGLAAIEELRAQCRGATGSTEVFPEPCAFNVFTHESAIDIGSGRNGEEEKIISETRRIWSDDSIGIVPTCVRVPVVRAHSQSVLVTLSHEATVEEARVAMRRWGPISLLDDRAGGVFPTPLRATGGDSVLVGRLRAADGDENWPTRELCLWLSGDQLRKGAALNAIQIAEAAVGRLSRVSEREKSVQPV